MHNIRFYGDMIDKLRVKGYQALVIYELFNPLG